MDKFFPKIYLRDYVEYVKLYLAFLGKLNHYRL
jgi:hypothetical protein